VGSGRLRGHPRTVLSHCARAALLAGVVSFAIAVWWRHGRPGQIVWVDVGVYGVVYVAAAALLLAQQHHDRHLRRGWRWLGWALLTYAAGNVLFSLVVERSDNPSYPSVADAFYLAWYPLTYLGLLNLLRGSLGRTQAGQALDGLITGLGAAAVSVAAVVDGVLTFDGASFSEILVNLAYPVADLLLLTLLAAGVSIVGSGVSGSGLLLAGGLGITAWADLIYLLQESTGAYVEGGWVDLLWLLGVAAIAGAGSVYGGSLTRPGAGKDGWVTLVPPAVFAVISVVVIGLHQAGLIAWQAVVPADAAVLLALVRAALRVRELRGLKTQEIDELARLARTDELTGLANRRGLSERCLGLVETAPDHLSVLVLGLDQLKDVNDALGHDRGDRLVRQLAERLTGLTPDDSGWGRLNGSEFALILPAPLEVGRQIGSRIVAALDEPFPIDDLHLHVTGRIGLVEWARSSSPACDPVELLRLGSLALHQARREREQTCVYHRSEDSGRERLRLTEQLRNALAGTDPDHSGTVVVHLQPQIHLTCDSPQNPSPRFGHRVAGIEALARWIHPTRGLLPPAEFLPLAAEAGLLSILANVVLEAALAACQLWRNDGCHVAVAVNLSAGDVLDIALVDRVASALRRHGLPPQALVLELTEDTLLIDPVGARKVLSAVRALGVAVSIDDYGTGYSSLAYLQDLPADELKLDRAFTQQLGRPAPTSERARAIIRSTIELAHSLGMRIVVEGIEDQATLDLLATLGADIGQGFHIAVPLPPDRLRTWLSDVPVPPAPHRAVQHSET
jgi:diguanylate cyclase (GGDEF)-like protein